MGDRVLFICGRLEGVRKYCKKLRTDFPYESPGSANAEEDRQH